ncbi:MAG TPA: GNAT family N-acetyltransferase [Dehalococcoidales bacterium]|nr:GNAT family N-acetyltransferase [Dehalococcoidales bacterium]
MSIEIFPVSRKILVEYEKIPISFTVDSKYEIKIVDSGLGGFIWQKIRVSPPYVKDYDAEEKPSDWLKIFKMDNWRVFFWIENKEVRGGAVVVANYPEVHLLDGRADLALLWDIRVKPEYRSGGAGTRLFQYAAIWAKQHGCTQLKIETQNTNVPACEFYVHQGCELGEINFHKYINSKFSRDDIMLCFYLDLLKYETG